MSDNLNLVIDSVGSIYEDKTSADTISLHYTMYLLTDIYFENSFILVKFNVSILFKTSFYPVVFGMTLTFDTC